VHFNRCRRTPCSLIIPQHRRVLRGNFIQSQKTLASALWTHPYLVDKRGQKGLDGRAVVDVISKGAAQSWQMENRFEWVLDGDYQDNKGFAVDWMRKLPVTALVDQLYAQVQKMGGGRWDTSSLVMPLK